METTKVLTSLLVLTLTGPSLGYPYTRGVLSRNSERAPRDRQFMDSGYSDYLDGYVQDEQYGLPEYRYQPAYRNEYVPQRQRISAEALAALLPYLTTSSNDYADDYNFYSDNDGTWYDDVANDDLEADTSDGDSDSAALLKFLIDHRNGRYSLEDLETLEREAEMEDNTENQLHALMAKKINKKSSMPLLGARQIAVAAPALVRKGQKEEALDVPSTSIRRPVFGRQINTQAEETEPQAKRNIAESSSNSGIISRTQQQQPSASAIEAAAAAAAAVPVISANPEGSLAEDAASGVKDDSARTTMTPFMQSKYEALIKYLDRERKVRQNQDIEQELQQETKSQPQKRFVSEQDDDLSRQLANLKKKVVA